MGRRNTQLARRPKTSPALRPRYLLSAAPNPDREPQYTLTRTDLGEFALHWTADWLAGLFCITDFPRDWGAFIRGAAHEALWPGTAPFAGSFRVSTYSNHSEEPAPRASTLSLPKPFILQLPALPP